MRICVLKLSDTCLKLLFEIGQTTMGKHGTKQITKKINKLKILKDFV